MAANDKHDPGVEEIEAQMRILREDVATLTRQLKDLGAARASEAGEAAAGRAREVFDRSGRALRAGQARAEHTAQSVEAFVADKPAQALLVALGFGIVLGWLSRR